MIVVKGFSDSFTADASGYVFHQMFRNNHRKHDKREPELLPEEFRCTELLCLYSRMYCCRDFTSKFKFKSNGLNKFVLPQSGDRTLDNYRRVMDEKPILRQQTEVSAQTVTLLLRMDEQRKDSPTLIQKQLQRLMEFILNLST